MAWTDALNQLLQRYTGAGAGTAAAPEDAHGDYVQVSRQAPPEVVADGLSTAFRSDQTPAFSDMVGSLFRQSNPQQKAGLLNNLLGSLGPAALASLPGIGALAGAIGSGKLITPEQTAQVTPEQAAQVAAHAQKNDPSIIDGVSRFYAQHPEAVKAIGTLGITIALQHILRKAKSA
jgi:hypothetical protein